MKDKEIQDYFNKHGHLNDYAKELEKLDPAEMVQLLIRIGLGSYYPVKKGGKLTGRLIDLENDPFIDLQKGEYNGYSYIIKNGCIDFDKTGTS